MFGAVHIVRDVSVSRIEIFFFRRKGWAIWLVEVVRRNFKVTTLRINTVNVAGTNFAFGDAAFIIKQNAIRWIGELDAAVRFYDDIVWRIEALTLIAGR